MNKYTFGNFISQIQNYESDTFSAQGWKITRSEAEAVAMIILNKWSLNNLDGIEIVAAMEELREKTNIKRLKGQL